MSVPTLESLRRSDEAALAARRGTIERRLTEIWRDVLGSQSIGIHDDYFELGGDSVCGAKIVARIAREFEVTIPMFVFFRCATIAALAEWLASNIAVAIPECASFELQSRPERLPLSYAQQRLWFLTRMEGVSEAYHIPWGMRLRGELDVEALR
jgi:hypothetical protein